MRRLIITIFLLILNCHVYNVNLREEVDESTVEVVKVPSQMRASGFHEEEDLTPLCGDKQIVHVVFMSNTPFKVWCK